jgi:hypothetical protein
MNCRAWGFILLGLCLTSCDWVRGLGATETVPLSDPKLRPFADMYTVDREKLGFTPVGTAGMVKIERRYGKDAQTVGYDVMLHMYGVTSRTIAFRREEDGKYRWIGEQETFYGPVVLDTPKSRVGETITVSYSGVPLRWMRLGHSVSYFGPNHELRCKRALTLEDVRPLTKQWSTQRDVYCFRHFRTVRRRN